jgi:hypothetical protein
MENFSSVKIYIFGFNGESSVPIMAESPWLAFIEVLKDNGFEIIEMATLGIFKFPKFRFSFSFVKSILHFILVKFFILLNPESEGNTYGPRSY